MRSRTFFLGLLACFAAPAAAGDVQVAREGCAGLRVVARDAPMSQIMTRLSRELGFALEFKADVDRTVSVELEGKPPKVLAELASAESVILRQEPDAKCPGQARLAKVWVLPKGEAGPPAPAPLTPRELYEKAHGITPPPKPEDRPSQ
jgi:hypothetical protein